MPGFDGTGPQGYGPMTGGGRGNCRPGGGVSPREFGRGFGRGQGRGGGRGFGRGAGYGRGFGGGPGSGYGATQPPVPQWNPADEAAALKQEITTLQGELEQLRARLAQVESKQ